MHDLCLLLAQVPSMVKLSPSPLVCFLPGFPWLSSATCAVAMLLSLEMG